ncbi:MAG: hypothetical protein AAF490_32335 [Chloroflexota bacterium]
MEDKLKIILAYIIWFGFLLLFTGCQPASTIVSSSSAPDESTSIQQGEPTPISTLVTPTVTLSQIEAETPTIFTIETATPTKMPTPRPTLSFDEAVEQVINLLRDNQNPDCLLPCWWGATPGITNWDEIEPLLITIGRVDRTTPMGVSIELPLPESLLAPGFDFNQVFIWNEDKILTSIQIDSINISGYDPVTMMTLYGVPDEVWLNTMPAPREEILPLQLIIVYQEKGISFRYYVNANKVKNMIEACFEPGYIETERPDIFPAGPRIYLWEPEEPKPIEEISPIPREHYFPLETKTDLSPETLFEKFTSSTEMPCISTQDDLW